MKRVLYGMVISLSLLLVGCSSTSSSNSESETTKNEVITEVVAVKEENVKPESDEKEISDNKVSSSKSYSSSGTAKTASSFTNKYGTPTTKCAKPGCNNYIASSGDTCYCPTHSNRCLECNKYIDGDAMYCLDCIAKAASSSSSDNSYNYSSNPSNFSGGGYSNDSDGYSYDSSDPYYSANDHNGDGKINDEEFQDAMGDLLDDLLAANGY